MITSWSAETSSTTAGNSGTHPKDRPAIRMGEERGMTRREIGEFKAYLRTFLAERPDFARKRWRGKG